MITAMFLLHAGNFLDLLTWILTNNGMNRGRRKIQMCMIKIILFTTLKCAWSKLYYSQLTIVHETSHDDCLACKECAMNFDVIP